MDGRIKFGIQGLDKALNGGIPQENIVLISGGAGTGKTTLALQFMYNGAKLFGEKSLYISTEQTVDEIHKTASQFGWETSDLEKNGTIKIVCLDISEGGSFFERIEQEVTDFQPKRVVVDSATTLTDSLLLSAEFGSIFRGHMFSPMEVIEKVAPFAKTERLISKSILYHLIDLLKKQKATAILTSELPEKTDYLSADEVSEFIADGVLILDYLSIGETVSRSLKIRKMRYSSHEKRNLPYEIESTGVELKGDETFKVD